MKLRFVSNGLGFYTQLIRQFYQAKSMFMVDFAQFINLINFPSFSRDPQLKFKIIDLINFRILAIKFGYILF